ncbi:MAG TPA: acyltransferase [Solirubrobacterales bacterium]|jgi:peptidoglycan/LPS O-acetylase OafA/YrhL|nr:acyltransferase [Solirubrobacterales bacterium]
MDAARPSTEKTPSRRLAELDAVRGLAALIVVISHLAITIPAIDDANRANGLTVINLVRFSPLAGFIEGGAAVIVFFVLSGYVLALSYERGRQTYGGFLVRRVARLWFPYAAAVALAIVLAALLGDEVIGAASRWVNGSWQGGIGLASPLEHFSLVWHMADSSQFDPVIWTLMIEMRISLIFPLLLVALGVFGWRISMVGGVLLCVVGIALNKHLLSDFNTLQYVMCFLAGAILARHHETIARLMGRTVSAHRFLLLAVALLLFTYGAWMPPELLPGPLGAAARSQVTLIIADTLAAVLFIALARFPGRARAFLRSALPQYFGRVSYSLYLLHAVMILAILHLVDPGNVGLIVALMAPILLISIVLAHFSQRYIEAPSQRLGRRLARRVEGRHELPRPDALRDAASAPAA